MGETAWMPVMIAIVVGVAVGAVLVFRGRRADQSSHEIRAQELRAAERRGIFKGATVAAVVCTIGIVLWSIVRPEPQKHDNNASVRMNASVRQPVDGADPDGDDSLRGHPQQGQAQPIVAKDTPRLARARAAVAAEPNSTTAQIELGYALAEAGGWIELFRHVQTILAENPNQPDGLIQFAMLRFAMRQSDKASLLIDRVLASEPHNTRALEVGGRIAFSSGNLERAESLLSQANDRLDNRLQKLLDEVRKHSATQNANTASDAN